jgi:hypothetical protein
MSLDRLSRVGRRGSMSTIDLIGAATGRDGRSGRLSSLPAAELVRRNYSVSFTMGNNTPVADLIVGTLTGNQFWIDVKGFPSKPIG